MKIFLTLLFLFGFCFTYSTANAQLVDGSKKAQCKTNAQCDDGNFCNGTEYCSAGQCKRDTKSPCSGQGEFCNKKTQACELRLCTQQFMCSDGNWCNGQEVCDPARGQGQFSDNYGKGYWGCFAGQAKCPTGDCNETAQRCEAKPARAACTTPDADGDGHAAIACGGDDCDDSDPNVSPGSTEVCDAMGIDEDCNPSTFGSTDADGDGEIDSRCCNGERCGTDCDDRNMAVKTRGVEVCNEMDDNCDGSVDEGVLLEVFQDNDQDGFGNASRPQLLCPIGNKLRGYSINSLDCDDTDRAKNPALGTCGN